MSRPLTKIRREFARQAGSQLGLEVKVGGLSFTLEQYIRTRASVATACLPRHGTDQYDQARAAFDEGFTLWANIPEPSASGI